MSNGNNHGREYYGELDNSFEWQDSNEWGDPEDLIHAKKKHQDHRGRNKRDVRRNIDDIGINDRQNFSEILNEDFDDKFNLF